MKLIIAVINRDDANAVNQALTREGFSSTRLATTGGFLRAGNTTLLIGVEEDRFQHAMEIIEQVCKSRKQIAPAPTSMVGMPSSYTPYPIEVVVGGATVFVLTVDQFTKL